MFFAGDDAVELPGVGAGFREVDESGKALGTAHEQDRILGVHVGDEKRGEEIAVGLAVFLEFGDELVPLGLELREADLFDL